MDNETVVIQQGDAREVAAAVESETGAAAVAPVASPDSAAASSDGAAASQVVLIDSGQWDYMAAQMRLDSTLLLFVLLVSCAIMGVVSSSLLLRGWRK